MNKKKKILIDLDVLTVALWSKRDERKHIAESFIQRVRKREFEIVTLSDMLKLTDKWKNKELVKKMIRFYFDFTSSYIDDAEISENLKRGGIHFDSLLNVFLEYDIKYEDILLIIACSINEAILVTLNKKHLKNNEEVINQILERFGMSKIQIKFPNEI